MKDSTQTNIQSWRQSFKKKVLQVNNGLVSYMPNFLKKIEALEEFREKKYQRIMDEHTDEEISQMQAIAKDYQVLIPSLSQMIVTGLETQKPPATPGSVMATLHNNDGYDVPKDLAIKKKGKTLTFTYLGKTYPIGYNIFIPESIKKVDRVIIEAYGGFNSQVFPLGPNELERNQMFYDADIPVIHLNLPDLLQGESQFNMGKELQAVIHAGINEFFHVISKEPERIDPSLKDKSFDEAEYFLYGASFGGRTAIRHGQLYPHTFTGYISHNGSVSQLYDLPIMMIEKAKDISKIVSRLATDIISALRENPRKFKNAKELLPIYHVEKSVDPMLILHNRDDNNLPIQVSLSFYEELQRQNKSHLAKLHIFQKGNPVPFDIMASRQKGKKPFTGSALDIVNKGHRPPLAIEDYINTIKDFMHQSTVKVSSLHQYRCASEKLRAARYIRTGNDKDKFLSFAMEMYQTNKAHRDAFAQDPARWDEIWEYEYKPLQKALYKIKKLTSSQGRASDYVEFIQNLIDNHLLSDEVVKNALKNHAKAFRELYKEMHDYQEITVNNIYDNPFVIDEFRGMLIDINPLYASDLKSFLLENLILANLPVFTPYLCHEPEQRGMSEVIEKMCKGALEESIINMKTKAMLVLQKAAKASLESRTKQLQEQVEQDSRQITGLRM